MAKNETSEQTYSKEEDVQGGGRMIGRKTVSQCVSEDYCKGWNDAVDAMPKWISVKAGLPKAYRNVDIVFGSHDSIGYYSPISKRWYDSHNIQVDGVTHWKYRDEPPKEDKE